MTNSTLTELPTVNASSTLTNFSSPEAINPVESPKSTLVYDEVQRISATFLPTPAPSNKLDLYDVEVSKDHYAKLFQDGYLVNLHVSVWGMAANLDEKDLKLDKQVSKLIKLGKKMLIDPEKLNEFKNMESKARRYLYKNSYDFPIADAHFVPKQRLGEVLKKLAEYKVEFYALVDKFVENYPDYKAAILANEEYKDMAEYIEPLYPSAETIASKFGFDMTIFELAAPKKFDTVEVDEQLEQYKSNAVAQLEEFADNAITTLRIKLLVMTRTLIEKIKSKELISKANLNTIREEIDNFRALNFLGDTLVEAEVAKLDTLISGNHNFKTDEANVALLQAALTAVRDAAHSDSDVQALRAAYFQKD